MQYQQRTNALSVDWRSCQSVTLQDGVLHCLLEPQKAYDLAEAYEDNLHVRFANANSERELIDFIRAWGPLYSNSWQAPPSGAVSLRLDLCRAYQNQMKVLIGALTAFKWKKGEREALEKVIEAESAFGSEALPPFVTVFQIEGDVLEWVKKARLAKIRSAIRWFVNTIMTVQFPLRFDLRHKGGRPQVLAGWNFLDLKEALLWMVWFDEFTKHPVICCEDCRTVFRGETARARKYCSAECGHRVTARKAMRKKRAAKRAGRM
jgi:hypothetical protein